MRNFRDHRLVLYRGMSVLFLAGAAMAVMSAVAFLFLLKMIFWVVFFPVRLLFKLLFGVGGLLIGVMAVPIIVVVVGVGLLVGLIAAVLALLLPLLPFVLLAFVGWAIYKSASHRPASVI